MIAARRVNSLIWTLSYVFFAAVDLNLRILCHLAMPWGALSARNRMEPLPTTWSPLCFMARSHAAHRVRISHLAPSGIAYWRTGLDPKGTFKRSRATPAGDPLLPWGEGLGMRGIYSPFQRVCVPSPLPLSQTGEGFCAAPALRPLRHCSGHPAYSAAPPRPSASTGGAACVVATTKTKEPENVFLFFKKCVACISPVRQMRTSLWSTPAAAWGGPRRKNCLRGGEQNFGENRKARS